MAHAYAAAVVLGDVLENYRDGRRQIPPLRLQNALSLSHLLRPVLRYAAGMECAMLPWADAEALRSACYAALLGAEGGGDSYADWLRVYNAEPTLDILDRCARLFGKRLVIGFGLPPVLQRALTSAGIPWLHLSVHPVRFMNDTLLALACNNDRVMDIAEAHSVPESDILFAAAHVQAQYAPEHVFPANWLYPDSLLVTAPSFYDAPQVKANGSRMSLLDRRDDVIALAREYRHVYAWSQLTADFLPEERALLHEELGATFIEKPYFRHGEPSSYLYLTHPSLVCATGIFSAQLEEITWFDKKTVPFHAVTPGKTSDSPLPEAVPLDVQWTDPAFWNAVISALCDCSLPDCTFPRRTHQPSLRLLLRRGAGGDFDDTRSTRAGYFAHSARAEAKEAQWACTWIASGLANAYAEPLGQQPEPSGTTPFAIYAAGDGRIIVPAIVALKSFGWHLGNAHLYYLAGEGELSPEGAALLAAHGITLLTSNRHHGFKACYRGSPPTAYLQLAGPELLSEEGFAYSLAIQPDTLCLRSFATDAIFAQTNCIAAPINSFDRLSNGFAQAGPGVPWSTAWQGADDPGFVPSVLFCNHEGLRKTGFFDKAQEQFRSIGAENLPLNEESLLHVMEFESPGFCVKLSDVYSFLPVGRMSDYPYVLHYDHMLKPWKQKHREFWSAREEILYPVWKRAASMFIENYRYK